MQELLTALMILGMFIIRLGVPLALILVVGYFLSRLDAQWQAEAQAQRERNPIYQAALRSLPQEATLHDPCWQVRGCDSALYSQCAASKDPTTPCWIARFQAEGALPPLCQSCQIFTTARFTADQHAAVRVVSQMAE